MLIPPVVNKARISFFRRTSKCYAVLFENVSMILCDRWLRLFHYFSLVPRFLPCPCSRLSRVSQFRSFHHLIRSFMWSNDLVAIDDLLILLQVLPDYILAIMLIVLLAATANRTLRKGIRSFNKETQAQQVCLR